jgi:hypothetical protein
MAYEKTWQFDMNRLYVPAVVPTAYIKTGVWSAGGGSLGTGWYYYSVTATVNGIEGCTQGNEIRVETPSSGGNIVLTWTAVPGATAYTVYRGGSPQAYGVAYKLGNVTTYTDTNVNTGARTISYNQTYDLFKYNIWYWKAFLTGQIGGATQGLWTVAGSSDGVTGAMDGVDRWTSTYTGTKIVTDIATWPHSWIVLQSPVMAGKTWYILIDAGNSDGKTLYVTLGVDAPPTGGSNTTAPTVQNAAPLPGMYIGQGGLPNYPNGGASRFHGMLATDGSFILLASRCHTQKFMNGFIFQTLSNVKGNDLYPGWLALNTDYTLTAGYGSQQGAGNTGPDYIGYSVMRTPPGNGYDAYGGVIPQTANWPAGEDRFDGSFADYPLWISKRATGNGYVGVRGRVQDIMFTTGYYSSGDGPPPGSVDNLASPQWMNVGAFRFPTNQRIKWEP